LLPEDQQLLTDQQLRDASPDQNNDLVARIDMLLQLEFDSLGEAEAVKAALGEVDFDSPSEVEAVRAALEDPTSPLEVTYGLRARIGAVVETKEY